MFCFYKGLSMSPRVPMLHQQGCHCFHFMQAEQLNYAEVSVRCMPTGLGKADRTVLTSLAGLACWSGT